MSTERYVPNGTPLTPRERELLVILMEECAEVIQAASKLIRFGKRDRPPECAEHNVTVLSREVGEMLNALGWLDDLIDHDEIDFGDRHKQQRTPRFLQTDPDPPQ